MWVIRKCAYSDVSGDASSGSRWGSDFSESGVPLRLFCLFNRSCVARIVLVATAEKIILIIPRFSLRDLGLHHTLFFRLTQTNTNHRKIKKMKLLLF